MSLAFSSKMFTRSAAVAAAGALLALWGCGDPTQTGAAAQPVADAPATDAAASPELDVPYVPTPEAVVDKMLQMGAVGPKDYVIDLGSGDGRIPIAAARKYGARGFGVDLNPERISEANANAKAAGVTDKVEFRRQDLFKTKIADATVLTMYLLPTVNMQLRPRILSELKPGTRVVSHAFDMEDWRPDEEASVDDSILYLWIVPAQVQGRWRVAGLRGGDMTLDLRQSFQQLEGTATVAGRPAPIREGKVRGESFSLLVDTPAGPRLFSARLRGEALTPAPAPAGASVPLLTGWKAAKAS